MLEFCFLFLYLYLFTYKTGAVLWRRVYILSNTTNISLLCLGKAKVFLSVRADSISQRALWSQLLMLIICLVFGQHLLTFPHHLLVFAHHLVAFARNLLTFARNFSFSSFARIWQTLFHYLTKWITPRFGSIHIQNLVISLDISNFQFQTKRLNESEMLQNGQTVWIKLKFYWQLKTFQWKHVCHCRNLYNKKNISFLRRMFRYNLLVEQIYWFNWEKIIKKIGAKELEIMSFNSIYTSCRSISSIRSRSNGLHDGWPSTYDATTTWWSRFPSRLCTLPSRILWTSFVINSIIVVIKVIISFIFYLLPDEEGLANTKNNFESARGTLNFVQNFFGFFFGITKLTYLTVVFNFFFGRIIRNTRKEPSRKHLILIYNFCFSSLGTSIQTSDSII